MTREEAEWIEAAGGGVLSWGTIAQGAALGSGRIELVYEDSALVRFDLDPHPPCLIEIPLDLLVPDFQWRPADA